MRKILLITCLLFVACSPSQSETVFKSKAWGFSMKMPEGWLRTDSAFIHENVQEYELTDEQLDKMFAMQNNGVLLLALMKYDPEQYSGVIPTIKINGKKADVKDQATFLQNAKQSFDRVMKIFDNAQYESEPASVSINGVPMVYLTFSYDLKNDGKTYRVRTYSYSALRKGYFIQFNFTDIPSNDNDCSSLFKELASSIIFNKK